MIRETLVFVLAAGAPLVHAEPAPDEQLQQSSDDHMREELGVNPITAPQIQQLLKDLETFRPIPIAMINADNRDQTFNNRMQTAMHFGSLVADGFMLTLAERPGDIEDVGRALIKQSRALGVNDRLTRRSKSLLDLSGKGDWVGMRQELIRTQSDVEQSMMDLRDEEMAHMVSLGGWLRGFQLGAESTSTDYTPTKANLLGRVEIMEYFLDRLDTLHPRLKKTQLVSTLVDKLKQIRAIALTADDAPPTLEQVQNMRKLANEAMAAATANVDAEGNFATPAR